MCLLAHSWEQIGSRFFPNVSKDTVNRRLRKLVDIALNDIRQVFEGKHTVQRYYTKNVLQTRIDFKDDEWFRPFIEFNSDAMAEVDSRVGTLHLATSLRSWRLFARFLARSLHSGIMLMRS